MRLLKMLGALSWKFSHNALEFDTVMRSHMSAFGGKADMMFAVPVVNSMQLARDAESEGEVAAINRPSKHARYAARFGD